MAAHCSDELVGAVVQADRQGRQQLRLAAVARQVVHVDFGTAVAVLAVVGDEDLAPVVDLSDSQGSVIAGGGQERRGRRIGLGGVDDRGARLRAAGSHRDES